VAVIRKTNWSAGVGVFMSSTKPISVSKPAKAKASGFADELAFAV
jgi:hypothetical protein